MIRSHRLRAAAGNSGGGAVVFDFTGNVGGSLPAGLYDRKANVSGLTQTISFVSAGLSIPGDAPNDNNSYPIAVNSSFSGDYLFQLSTRIDQDSSGGNWCSDAGLALFDTNITSSWVWKWGYLSGRITAQNNCPTPYLYGTNVQYQMSQPNSGQVLQTPYVADGGFVTMHLRHLSSQSKTTYNVTLGSKDWTESGTAIGTQNTNTNGQPNTGIIEVPNSFSGTYYVGIGADDDTNACIIDGFRYQKL